MKTKTLFETPIEVKTPTILLVDCSASTSELFEDKQQVFDKMFDVIKTYIKHKEFQIIFWNSDSKGDRNQDFPNGALVYSYKLSLEGLAQPFKLAKLLMSKHGHSTMPDKGFKAIPKEWIDNKEATHIYFVTDGQIDYGQEHRTNLSSEIRQLFAKFNNIHLHILTIEARNIDFGNLENVNNLAGGDVYQVLKNEGLTGRITEFTTWCKNQSAYTHISNVIAPSGFVSFGNNFFSEAKMDVFVNHLFDLIQQNKDNEDELLKIVQKLTATLRMLLNDKPIKVQGQITQMFCDMFENTCLDPCIVRFMLVDTIKNEQLGQAMVISEYRAKLKDLFKQANDLLFQDVKNSIGMVNEFMTFPVNDVIVIGKTSLVHENLKLIKNSYPCSGVMVNSLILPALPLQFNAKSLLNQQCLRQYMRAIVAQLYGLNPMDDLIIYVILGISLKVSLSNMKSPKIVSAWKEIARNMLLKKRLNSTMTELDRIQAGDLPIPNSGKIEQFYEFMDKVGHIVGISCKPLTLWYAMCLSLQDEKIMTKQLIHCHESISQDFGKGCDLLKELEIKSCYRFVDLPIESTLEYTCIITLDDVSQTGGFRFVPHKTLSGSICAPNFVVSQKGYESMTCQDHKYCPICYKELDAKWDFEKIGKKPQNEVIVFDSYVKNPFVQEIRSGMRVREEEIGSFKEKNSKYDDTEKENRDYVVRAKSFKFDSEMKKICGILSRGAPLSLVGYGSSMDQTSDVVDSLVKSGVVVVKKETFTVNNRGKNVSGVRFVLKNAM